MLVYRSQLDKICLFVHSNFRISFFVMRKTDEEKTNRQHAAKLAVQPATALCRSQPDSPPRFQRMFLSFHFYWACSNFFLTRLHAVQKKNTLTHTTHTHTLATHTHTKKKTQPILRQQGVLPAEHSCTFGT